MENQPQIKYFYFPCATSITWRPLFRLENSSLPIQLFPRVKSQLLHAIDHKKRKI